MALKIEGSLKQNQTQKQTMSAVQLQSLTLLSMPLQELNRYIDNAILENPVLELSESTAPGEGRLEEPLHYEADGWMEDAGSYGNTAAGETAYGEDRNAAYAVSDDTLRQSLLLQASLFDEAYQPAARAIIQSLEGDGYLRESIEQVAQHSGLPEISIKKGLALVQGLEPKGIAARNLGECLLLQVDPNYPLYELAARLTAEHLPELAKGKVREVATALDVPQEDVETVFDYLKTLQPYPASELDTRSAVPFILPDILVSQREETYVVTLNNSGRREIDINPHYRQMYSEKDQSPDLRAYLREKIEAANTLIRCVKHRSRTLDTITKIVLDRQRAYLTQGARGLVPLSLKQVAQQAGMHESTVSRAISGKYIQTPRGIHPYKFFFPRAVPFGETEVTTDVYVKERISALVAAEDPKAPLSDARICELLAMEQFRLSRRTVTKYRLEAGLPGRSVRRRECLK